MEQSPKPGPEEPFVVIYEAESAEEATILRGLLQSAGIESPPAIFSDPFPVPNISEITHGAEIMVRASQAKDARQILKSYGETAGQRPSEP
jgi:hypothetical protein